MPTNFWPCVALVCVVGAGSPDQQPPAQYASPTVEHTRPHPRPPRAIPPGRRWKLTAGPLFLPETLSLKDSVPLFVHFHGAAWLPEVAATRHGGTAVVAVQLGAGSQAYQKPFADPKVFGELLREAE